LNCSLGHRGVIEGSGNWETEREAGNSASRTGGRGPFQMTLCAVSDSERCYRRRPGQNRYSPQQPPRGGSVLRPELSAFGQSVERSLALKIGRQWRFRESALPRWLQGTTCNVAHLKSASTSNCPASEPNRPSSLSLEGRVAIESRDSVQLPASKHAGTRND
jgi:hypothetical protein